MKIKNIILIAVTAFIACSCNPHKEATYFWDIDNLPIEALNTMRPAPELTATPGDLISISLTSDNPESVKIFNKGYSMSQSSANNSSGSSDYSSSSYYLVDNNGDIQFPVIGKMHIGGLKKSEIEEVVRNAVYPKYLTTPPAIEIRFQNFSVTVLGETGCGIKKSLNERMSILELIAQSGDLPLTALRDNILLIRTNPDGTRVLHRYNMHDPNIINDPYFYLQQNDLIYVTMTKAKARTSFSVPPVWSFATGLFSFAISLVTMIVTIVKK